MGAFCQFFLGKNSKTLSSLNFLQSGPQRFTKSDFSGLAPIRRVLTYNRAPYRTGGSCCGRGGDSRDSVAFNGLRGHWALLEFCGFWENARGPGSLGGPGAWCSHASWPRVGRRIPRAGTPAPLRAGTPLPLLHLFGKGQGVRGPGSRGGPGSWPSNCGRFGRGNTTSRVPPTSRDPLPLLWFSCKSLCKGSLRNLCLSGKWRC